MLVKLCEETEPTPKQLLKMSGEKNSDMTDLFTPEMIDAKFYLEEVKAEEYDNYSVIDIMRACNTIWRWRMKVKKDGWPDMSSICLLYTSPSPRDRQKSRMPSSA